MAGDYPHALGNIHTIESPYFPNSFYPEADILKAVIYFANCQYDDADHDRRARSRRSTSRSRTSCEGPQALQGRGPGGAVLQVPEGGARRQGEPAADASSRVVENALSRSPAPPQPRVRAACSTTRTTRFKKAPASFQNSPLGNDVTDALQLARDIAVRNAGKLARERYQRNLDELNEHLRDGAKILIDITAAQRNQLDAAIAERAGHARTSRRSTAS